jgi:type I restriction enzyme S subunit
MELMAKQGFKQTEVGLIPEDWEIVKFNEIGDAIIGLTYSPKDVNSSGKLVHRSSNIQDNKLAYYDNVYVTCDVPEKLILKKNDILICVRNGSRNLIGKSAIIDGKSIGETFGAFMSVFRPNGYAPLIYQCFISDIVQSQINASLGATINQITNKTLNSFLTPLPPTLTEQKAIATALSDVDALITSLEQTITKKKAIKQGAMQQLLTPPHKGGKRLPGFEGECVEKTLGEISSMNSGGTPSSKVSEYYDGNIKWVSISDITKAGKYIDDSAKKITEKGLQNSSARLFPINTLLLAMYASIGKCCIARAEVTTSQAILGITTTKSLLLEFLYYYLTYKQDEIASQGQQGTQSNLNKGMVQDILINIPAIEEQKAIAQILSDMDAEITQLETKKEKYQAIKQGMMQELLTGKTRLI